ncbi:MAG: NUDIX domain-containing protein [Clostridia bacterium]|nr:NUDIX domain-containing protein [Clostridia bacterium]
MSDITIEQNYYTLNLRTSGMIVRNEQVLLCKFKHPNYYVLPGGRIKGLENSNDALARELREEVRIEEFDSRLVLVCENFFNENAADFHEINFIYQINTLEDICLVDLETGSEAFEWVALSRIKTIDFRPRALKEIITRKNDTLRHVIIRNDVPVGSVFPDVEK